MEDTTQILRSDLNAVSYKYKNGEIIPKGAEVFIKYFDAGVTKAEVEYKSTLYNVETAALLKAVGGDPE